METLTRGLDTTLACKKKKGVSVDRKGVHVTLRKDKQGKNKTEAPRLTKTAADNDKTAGKERR